MLKLDKTTALEIIPPKVTGNFLVLEIDVPNCVVMLQDLDQKPPPELYVELMPENFRQAMRWKKGTKIYATIRSKISTIEEQVNETGRMKGWTRKMCEKVLKETGSSWNDAVVQYFFEDNIEERD